MAAAFRKAIKGLKRLNRPRVPKADIKSAVSALKSTVAAVDSCFAHIHIAEAANGFLKFGNHSIGKFRKMIKSADLDGLVEAAGNKIEISEVDRAAFREVIGHTPDLGLKKITEVARDLKKQIAHLDTTIEKVDKLSEKAKKDVVKIETRLLNFFKLGAYAALGIGGAIAGVGWLHRATEARKGCHMVTTIDGKLTSCKIAALSCVNGKPDTTSTQHTGVKNCNQKVPLGLYNTTHALIRLVSLEDSAELKQDLARATKIPVAELYDKLDVIISNKLADASEVVEKATAYHNYNNICAATHPKVTIDVPECRMCSSDVDQGSLLYIDPFLYDNDNITFQCVTDPTYIDTIADLTLATGESFIEGLTTLAKGAWEGFKLLAMISGGVVVLLVVLLLVYRYAVPKETPPSEDKLRPRYETPGPFGGTIPRV